MNVRTRFAPSPTGFLHVGGVRTALFAWLVARQVGGRFILRIEDTDRERHVQESEQHIIESLKWLGLDPDEGPYRQSERLEIYKQWAQKLIDSGRAYADPYMPGELENLRSQAKQSKKPFLFRDHRPKDLPAWKPGLPLRFNSDPKSYKWSDEVMGELSAGAEAIDDFILLKSDGFPTYNFAHIIDDHLMEISHVIRSQEFLSSMPKFLNLYDALGIDWPKFATLPYVLGPDGKKKLSKRDGARDILDYKREGYLPEALASFLATLGWNDGTEQEIFTIDELIKKFDLGRVQHSGAKFDEKRLEWVNGHFIREMPLDKLYELAEPFWPPQAKTAAPDLKKRILEVTKERLKQLLSLSDLTLFFFRPGKKPKEISGTIEELFKTFGANGQPDPANWLRDVVKLIKGVSIIKADSLEEPLKDLVSRTAGQRQVLFGSLREALTGADQTPPIWEICYVLGREESVSRLFQVIAALEK